MSILNCISKKHAEAITINKIPIIINVSVLQQLQQLHKWFHARGSSHADDLKKKLVFFTAISMFRGGSRGNALLNTCTCPP